MHRIRLISVGPGHASYVTDLARETSARCGVLIGSREQLEAVGTRNGQILHEAWGVDRIFELLEKERGKTVGLLITGDAGIFSLAGRIRDRYGDDAIRDVVPGVSSLQVAFARIREPWLNVRAFTYRERPFEQIGEVLRCRRAAVFCDRRHTASVILQRLAEMGLFDEPRRIYVCQNLTLSDERVTRIGDASDLSDLPSLRFEIVLLLSEGKEGA